MASNIFIDPLYDDTDPTKAAVDTGKYVPQPDGTAPVEIPAGEDTFAAWLRREKELNGRATLTPAVHPELTTGGSPEDGGVISDPAGASTSRFANGWDAPEFTVPRFVAPRAFSYGAFVAPTAAEAENDEGYRLAAREGERAMKNFAAGEGLYRTPGTLQGLMRWRSALGAQQYGNVYGRRLGEWDRGYGAEAQRYERDFRDAVAAYNREYQVEADEFSRALASAGFNLDIENARNGNLLALYGIAARTMPTYQPLAMPSWSIGA